MEAHSGALDADQVPSAKRILCAIALVSAWGLVTSGSAAASSCANTDVQVSGLSQSQMESSIACLINDERTSPDGVTFIDRIQTTGYMRGARTWVVGENLVWGSGALSTPQALVTTWMNSPPHRENLLKPRFREIGIAAVVGTPESRSDSTGVTVSSEYGYRAAAKKRPKARKARKAKRRHAR